VKITFFRSRRRLLLAGVLLLLTVVAYQRLSVYGYDVRQDYRYPFQEMDAQIVQGQISGGRLTFAAPPAGCDTVLAELTVASTWLGLLAEPSLEFRSARGSLTQAVEMGGKGRRYVNLSALFAGDAPPALEVLTTRLSVPDQPVRLLCFRNDIDRQQRVLVISPHPDDAEIAAFGFYAGRPEAYIVTVTAGDAGRNKYDEVYADRAEQSLKKGELRVWNSITVPLLGGIPPAHAVNLGYFDSRLQEMAADPQRPVAPQYARLTDPGVFRQMNVSRLLEGRPSSATWQNLVGDLAQIIALVKPELIVAPYPRIDAHPDHKYATLATLQALQLLGQRSGRLLLYTNHCTSSEYVPYGPMHSGVSLPPAFDGRTAFNRIYSYGLSPEQQRDKYFALEAMNDLRLDTEWRSFSGTLKYLSKLAKNIIFNKDFSYFRRAVRADEVFFVVDLEQLERPDFTRLISD